MKLNRRQKLSISSRETKMGKFFLAKVSFHTETRNWTPIQKFTGKSKKSKKKNPFLNSPMGHYARAYGI